MKTGISTFHGLFGQGERVEIPVIQRDYAQGRNDEHSQEVRRRFLEALAGSLSSPKGEPKPLDLDFIYGRWSPNEKLFEPLDGQQRLTTLFLLHWYAACLDGAFDEFQSRFVLANGGSAFTYRTRPSAREFFDAFVHESPPLDLLAARGTPLSTWVTDAVWFVSTWYRDPTVRGCLEVLDAIHERFSTLKGTWKALVSTEAPAITFRLLPLGNFDLSDDLYVKMNARGKALTRFEIFKAELERFVAECFGDEQLPASPTMGWREYLSIQFDTTWSQFLWKHRSGTAEIDSRFMHLIRSVAVVRCLQGGNDQVSAGQIERLITTPQPGLPFFEEIGCLDRQLVEVMIGIIDVLAVHECAPTFLERVDYLKEKDLFRRILLARGANQEDGLTLVDWVSFSAWSLFLLRFSRTITDQSTLNWFHDWTRVITNLTRNSNIDRTDKLVTALRGLRNLAKHAGPNFLSQIADGALDQSSGFSQQQQREERAKARLICRDAEWRTLIERAETHRYFNGDIEFLLRFCGVFDRATSKDSPDWSDEEDRQFRKSFADWYERTCAVFPEDVDSWPRRFPDYLWERALLATGDYLLPRNRNLSFLDDKDRDASWKRLLRADTRASNRDVRRDVVRDVLSRVDPADPETSLRSIVNAGVQGLDETPGPGFRQCLVEDPRVIAYCGQRQLRVDDDSAFLLTRAQRNGKHVDLYLFALQYRLESRLTELAPFRSVGCTSVTDTTYVSYLYLSGGGFSLTVTKPGRTMVLRLRQKTVDPRVAARLAAWRAEGGELTHSVNVAQAEEAIVALASGLASLSDDAPVASDDSSDGPPA